MPYIKQERRKQLDVGPDFAQNAGELNYALTLIIKTALQEIADGEDLASVGRVSASAWAAAVLIYIGDKGESYQTFNDIIGAWTGAFMEFERRHPELMSDPGYQGLSEGFSEGLVTFYTHMVGPYEDLKIKENGDV